MANPAPTPAQQARFAGLRQPGWTGPTSGSPAASAPPDAGFPTWGTGAPRPLFTEENPIWGWQGAPGWVNDLGNDLVGYVLGTVAEKANNHKVMDEQGNINWFNATRAIYMNTGLVDASPDGSVGLSAAADLAVRTYDASTRVANTVGGGTAMIAGGYTSALIAGDWTKSSNPYARDGGITWQEAGEILNPLENETTIGQQAVYQTAAQVRNAVDRTMINLGMQDQVDAIQAFIATDNQNTLAARAADDDPTNDGMGSPWAIFDYDFNIFAQQERQQVFEANTPFKYMSGFLDAGWQMYAAPDAIVAMGLTRARNAKMVFDLGSEAGRARAADDLLEHAKWVESNGAEGRATAWGYQAAEFAGMNADELKYIPMVRSSNNPSYVSGVLGATRTPQEAGQAVLALAGDFEAQKALLALNPLAGDMLLLGRQTTDSIDEIFRGMNEASSVKPITPKDRGLDYLGQFTPEGRAAREGRTIPVEILSPGQTKHYANVIDEYATYFGSSWREVRMGGRIQVQGAARRAKKKAARKAGDFRDGMITIRNPLTTSFSNEAVLFQINGGRPVMVLRSAADKLTTSRRSGSGLFYLTDEMEFQAELDATLDTTPTLRRAAKAAGDGRLVPVIRDGNPTFMSVDEYRRTVQNEAAAIAATRGVANVARLRQQFLTRLESDLWHMQMSEYGITYDDAISTLRDFKYARNQVAEQIKERGWLKDGDMLVVPDEVLQSQLGESFPLLDFGMIDLMFKAQGLPRAGSKAARKSGALRPGRRQLQDGVRIFDMVWRPLALMRLGYTQRNVAEGGLRIMAAYGSLANTDYATAFGHIAVGVGNTARNSIDGLGRAGQNAGRVLTGRPTLKQLRREQRRDYNARKAIATQLEDVEKRKGKTEKDIAALQARADSAVAYQLGVEWKAGESTAWDDIQGEASGRIGEDIVFGPHVDELWVDPIHARKFENGWIGVGSGTGQDMGRFGRGPGGGSLTVEGVAKRGQRMDEDRLVLDEELTNTPFDSPVGTYLTPKQAADYEAAVAAGDIAGARPFWLLDRKRAAKAFLEQGNYLAYANMDGTYSRIRNINGFLDSLASNTAADSLAVAERVVVLPKGTPVKAVRSTVYGKTLDLNTPIREAYYDAMFRFAEFRRVEKTPLPRFSIWEDDPDSRGAFYSKFLNVIRNEVDELGNVTPIYEIKPEMSEWLDGVASLHNDLFDWGANPSLVTQAQRVVDDLSGLVLLMGDDPELARAVFGRLSAMKLDPKVTAAMEESGAIIRSGELRRILTEREADLAARRTELIDEAQYIKDYVWDADYVDLVIEDTDDAVTMFAGSSELPGGGYEPMRYDNEANVRNLQGVGFQYASGSPQVGGSYVIGERLYGWEFSANTNKYGLFNRPVTQRARDATAPEPRMYVLEPSNPDDFLDLDVQGYLERLDPRAVTADQARAASKQEKLIADVVMQSGLNLNPSEVVDDVYTHAKRYISEVVAARGPDAAPEETLELVMKQLWAVLGEAADFDAVRALVPGLAASDPQLARYAWAQKQWVDTLTGPKYGMRGVRHIGGRRVGGEVEEHPVHIWYEEPAVAEIDEFNDLFMQAVAVQQKWDVVYDESSKMSMMGNYSADDAPDVSTIAAFTQEGASGAPAGVADWIGTQKIVEAARNLGYGKIVVPNRLTPEGYDVIYLHDPSSANGNLRTVVDRALPTYIDEAALNSENVMDLRSAGAVAEGMGDIAKTQSGFAIRTKAAAPSAAGADRFTTAERLKLIQMMQDGERTHIAVNGPDGKPIYVTKSELLSSKGATQDYAVLSGNDDALAMRMQILSGNRTYLDLQNELAQQVRTVGEKRRAVSELDTAMQGRSKVMEGLGKQKTKRRIGMSSSVGASWEARQREYKGFAIADPLDPNEAYGNLARARSSSDMTVSRDLMGYTNDATVGLRRTSARVNYTPSDPLYWSALADDVNTLFRNDKITLRILAGESDEEIVTWLRSNTQETNALRRDSAFDPEAAVVQRRELVDNFLPDTSVRRQVVDGDVTADFLESRLSWREMPSLEQLDWVDQQNAWQRFTSSMMTVLGTIPENNLVRHPFYRARFMDEMRRQIDLMDDGVTMTDGVMTNLRTQAHAYALKSTRETLYTVNRLSTPAYALRFIVPFFPAWESSMKFWAKTFYDKPITAVRYAQFWDGLDQTGWSLDENMQPVGDTAGGSSILNLPKHLFSPGGGWLVVPFGSGDLFGAMALPKGSLNVILPGEYPWLPGVDPIVAVPMSWVANQKPLLVDSVKQWEAWGIPIGDAVATQILPFGVQSKEKDFLDLATEAVLPPTAKRLATGIRGEGSAEFTATADEIHRTRLARWDLDGRQGPPPDFADSVASAKDLYSFRAGAAIASPVALMPQSPFAFYTRESRRLDEKYRLLPDGSPNPDGPRQADDEFLRLYGEEFFRFTKSLSGSRASGISPVRGSQEIYEQNTELAGRLARIGENGEMLAMLTNPYGIGEEFSDIIYRAQIDAPIPGASGRFLRGGPATSTILSGSAAEDASQRDLGWRAFEKLQALVDAAALKQGLDDYSQNPQLVTVRQQTIAQIRQEYPAWGVSFDQRDTNGARDAVMGALEILNDQPFMSKHGDDPHIVALGEYMTAREMFVGALAERKANGGSDRIDAVANADLKEAWAQLIILPLTAPTADAAWMSIWNRWFRNDALLPVNETSLEVPSGT